MRITIASQSTRWIFVHKKKFFKKIKQRPGGKYTNLFSYTGHTKFLSCLAGKRDSTYVKNQKKANRLLIVAVEVAATINCTNGNGFVFQFH